MGYVSRQIISYKYETDHVIPLQALEGISSVRQFNL